ncbi:MAG TPA: PQQ-binding-like beta-propeller repeat protein [Solirubrobacteraceae bacterium]|nr:PQQ-binding-like beta-propeller repeat protein [Solirubrobacteraceae bacterium]
MRSTVSSRAIGVVVAVLASVAIAACGGGGSKSSSTPSAGTPTTGTQSSTGTGTGTTSSSQTSTAASLWSLPNADPDGTRNVSSQINSSNVSQLKAAWSIPIVGVKGLYGVFSSTPVFGSNGVAYLQDLGDNVYAVNVKTGKIVWKYKVPASDTNGEGPNGVTLVDGKIYGNTNRHAFALQASTGEQLWKTPALADPSGPTLKAGQGINIAPQVVDGKVFMSTSGQQTGGVAYALDANSGKVLWSFRETKNASERGAGGPLGTGGAWGTPVVENGTVYFGVANPYRSINDAIHHSTRLLYNDSTIALDENTGKLKWYMQAVPNDFHDWDMQIGPMYTANGPGGQPAVIDAGKMGYVYAMNAATGKLEWKTPVGKHNGHDNDGLLGLHHKLHVSKFPYVFCPGILGGVETQMAMADGVIYVPANNLCSSFKNKKEPIADQQNPTKGTGDFEAINVDTGKVMWDTKLPSSPYGSATVTNDLVFTTLFNGKLIAINRNTGKIVWSQQLSADTNAPLAIDGDTLITAASFASGAGQKAEIVAYSLSGSSSSSGQSTQTQTNTTASGNTSTSNGGSSAGVSVKAGMSVFESTCASCHTLAAAGSTGTVGPNLDQLKPSDALVVKQVTNGGGGMPAFGSTLSQSQIKSVALFVSSVAGKPVKGKVKKTHNASP